MRSVLTQALDLLLTLASPARCLVCNQSARSSVCAGCNELRQPPPERSVSNVPIVAAIRYAPPFDRAIQRFKYEARPDLAPRLVALWTAPPDLVADVLVPVPLHPRRLAERGYNQSALLASAFARSLRLPVDTRCLTRRRDVPRQARMDRAARLANVRGAFCPRAGARISGRRLLLVDDVVTTGATVSACIEALRSAGAEVAAVLAVASAGS